MRGHPSGAPADRSVPESPGHDVTVSDSKRMEALRSGKLGTWRPARGPVARHPSRTRGRLALRICGQTWRSGRSARGGSRSVYVCRWCDCRVSRAISAAARRGGAVADDRESRRSCRPYRRARVGGPDGRRPDRPPWWICGRCLFRYAADARRFEDWLAACARSQRGRWNVTAALRAAEGKAGG